MDERKIIRGWRLWVGFLMADVCVLVPVTLAGMFAFGGFMGGTPNGSAVFLISLLTFVGLALLNDLILSGVIWLRWFFYIVLSIMAFAALVFAYELYRVPVGALLLVIGLVFCPTSIVLIAACVRDST